MSSEKIVILGYSGHAHVVCDAILECGYNLIGYLDQKQAEKNPFDLPYLGTEYEFIENNDLTDIRFVHGIGDNKIRFQIGNFLRLHNATFKTIIHPAAFVSKRAKIKDGVFISANVSINAGSDIGSDTIINTGAIIEHGCIIEDAVHIAPGAVLAGDVRVNKLTFIGANAVIKQGISIGTEVIVGAGSVILKNIDSENKVVGHPGRNL